MILLDVDPNIVRPGWTPLLITLLLGAAMVFLYFSMRRQFRKIRTPDDVAEDAEPNTPEGDGADPAEESTSKRQPGTSS